MTLAPAVATIQEMQRLGLVDRANKIGAYLGEKLKALAARHPSIGDVRGIGLFWAVELVKDKQTKQPLNTMRDKIEGKPLVVDQVAGDALKRGVALQAWISHFVIAPPLIITEAEVDQGVAALDAALSIADAALATAAAV